MSASRWVLITTLFVLASVLVAAVLTPSLRERVQAYLHPPGREVLATVEGDLLNNGQFTRAVKYRDANGIFVQVLSVDKDGKTQLIDRLLLPDKKDGLFNLQGHVTRLAIADIDGDGRVELLAPSFDDQLVPHLNVFRYNPDAARFEPVEHEAGK
jgi:hypothetical protein